jgi:hypothetical protein
MGKQSFLDGVNKNDTRNIQPTLNPINNPMLQTRDVMAKTPVKSRKSHRNQFNAMDLVTPKQGQMGTRGSKTIDKRLKSSAQKEKDRIRKRIKDLENELSGNKTKTD